MWVGLLAGVLWLARGGLKKWIDGPEVTAGSGGWPDSQRPSGLTTDRPTADRRAAPSSSQATASSEPSAARGPAASPVAKKPAKAAGKKAAGPSKRRADSSAPGSWVVPNGTAEVLVTHPVKVKLASRVYRVPGMPMYDRTVADRCYATVDAAEADGFNRAAR